MNIRLHTKARRFTSVLLRVCLAASLLINPHFAHAQQRAASAITGRVITEDGQPRAGVAIMARSVGANSPAGFMQTDTDAAGRFTLTDLEPGAYTIEAYAPGYVRISPAIDVASRTAYHRPGDSVTLTMAKGGVITGRVTNTAGEPLVRISVRAIRRHTHDSNTAANSTPYFFYSQERQTDDRGIYRIYGLPPGAYIVVAGAARQNSSLPDAYGGLRATYHPSTTSDTATEIIVNSGDERTNIDIAFRGEPGRTVSGTLTGAIESSARAVGTQVSLVNASSGILEQSDYVQGRRDAHNFSFDGVPEGEYDLIARRGGSEKRPGAASPPQRITVRAADINGIELTLLPLATISGRIRIEPLTETLRANEICRLAQSVNATLEQVVVTASRSDAKENNSTANLFSTNRDTVPDARGDFILRDIEAGDYRFEPRPPGENLYVRNINIHAPPTTTTSSTAKPASQSKPPTPSLSQPQTNPYAMTIKAGEKISNVEITLAEGAARLQGRAVNATENSTLPSRSRINLVPVEAKYAAHSWRYHTTLAAPDGTWTLARLAPGTYRVLALKTEPDSTARLNSDARGRTELRRLAETTGTRIELAPCQSITDFALR